ncbi:type I restriction enzyme endonuclease domain-containing protein [Nitrosomonas sp.]|uniref:type I restriction enzyme endonuclease domain-containing protein n=1 Tax=Nitrosomonas sp. TaxID=42353 RepID=UPI0025EB07C3|nr:type I restriction enzyme endonuclease domain-containing protein [Nitrosomonas sp.]
MSGIVGPIQLDLTKFEYAFYTAVASNTSARELMQNNQLRELTIVLASTCGKTPR